MLMKRQLVQNLCADTYPLRKKVTLTHLFLESVEVIDDNRNEEVENEKSSNDDEDNEVDVR